MKRPHLSEEELLSIHGEISDLKEAVFRAIQREERFLKKCTIPARKDCHWTHPISKRKYNIMLTVRSKKERGAMSGVNCYLPYKLDGSWGFLLIRFKMHNIEKVILDFGPHVVDRYRQRYLNTNGLYLDTMDVIDRLVTKVSGAVVSQEENNAHIYWSEGAMMGNWHGDYKIIYMNTYISYREMKPNQKTIVDKAVELRGDETLPCPTGKAVDDAMRDASTYCTIQNFSPYRELDKVDIIKHPEYVYATAISQRTVK